MDWLQEYWGFIVVGALVVLYFVGRYVRKAARRYQSKLIADNREGSEARVKAEAKTKQLTDRAASESTMHRIVTFSADRAAVLAVLSSAKLGGSWKSERPGVWTVAGAKKVNGEHATVAALEDGPTGTQLVLLRAEDMFGIAMAEGNWRTLREKVIAAAQSVGAQESDGPALERHPVGDVAGLSPDKLAAAQHVWWRPGASG